PGGLLEALVDGDVDVLVDRGRDDGSTVLCRERDDVAAAADEADPERCPRDQHRLRAAAARSGFTRSAAVSGASGESSTVEHPAARPAETSDSASPIIQLPARRTPRSPAARTISPGCGLRPAAPSSRS